MQIVKADAVDAAAAVIPQHQSRMGRWIRREAPAEEVRQRLRIAHIGLRLRVHQGGRPARDLETVQLTGRGAVVPLLRAAGLNHKADIGHGRGVNHLLHVVRGKGSIRLQVRLAEVHKDRPAVLREGGSAKAQAQHESQQNCNGFFHSLLLLFFSL